jgi:hypothetical protein
VSDKNTGIIVDFLFPQKQKIVICDREQGIIEAMPESGVPIWRLCRGALLAYDLEKRCQRYFLHHIDIRDIPLAWARHDILFLHHILELATHFLSPAVGNAVAFDELRALYKACTTQTTPFFKKIFLVKFFLAVGLYPEHAILSPNLLGRLLDEPLDGILIDILPLEQEIDGWLRRCIHMHPQVTMFKTMHFLT